MALARSGEVPAPPRHQALAHLAERGRERRGRELRAQLRCQGVRVGGAVLHKDREAGLRGKARQECPEQGGVAVLVPRRAGVEGQAGDAQQAAGAPSAPTSAPSSAS